MAEGPVHLRPACGPDWGKWLAAALLAACAIAATYWPHGLAIFRYDRAALLSGEIWRLVSGHVVHLNNAHLLLNLAGLALISELLWRDLPLRHGVLILLVSMAGVSGLLWIFHPELAWYAGLSGVLHGLWAGCAVNLIGRSDRKNSLVALGGISILAGKLALELMGQSAQDMSEAIGAPVIHVAHVYGALNGGAYALIWRACKTWTQPHR